MKSDRKKQVKTTKERHGKDHYKKIGQKGGLNSPTRFTSETGKAHSDKRWGKTKEVVKTGTEV